MNLFKPNTRQYELTLAKTYVSKWTSVEAIRELIQNALDSESPFLFTFYTPEGCDFPTLRINSEFTTLQPNTLLLGVTSKADDKQTIGSFGEGFKLALLVLTREGYDVDVHNGDVLWKPSFKYNHQFKEELLVIEEHQVDIPVAKGLTFDIHCIPPDVEQRVRASCLKMCEVGEKITTAYGDILLDRPGSLYVGSLFICNTELKFGYDIKPEFIKLERDRQTVSNWDLKAVTKNIWFDTKQFERIAKMLEEKYPDLEYAEYGAPEAVKEACYRLFRKMHPGKIIAESQAEMEQMVKRGLTVYVGGSGFVANVKSSAAYRNEAPAVVRTLPVNLLTRWLSNNRGEMRSKAIESFRKEILDVADQWRLM